MYSGFAQGNILAIERVARVAVEIEVLEWWTWKTIKCPQMEKTWVHWSWDLWIHI